jgi:two-component system cell cycle sensor histidine kinase/response regulator CckA
VDLSFLLDLLTPGFQSLCGEGTILEVVAPSDLPAIWTDASKLKAALVELVRNACDATAESGGRVKLTVQLENAPSCGPMGFRTAERDGEWISMTVTDNGHGLSPATAARMFEPFYSTRKRKQAAGLGLNVAVDAVQQLGGALTHSSEMGATSFSILLPLKLKAPTESPDEQVSADQRRGECRLCCSRS